MKKFFQKSYRWTIIFTILLVGSFAFVMLDTFVIPKSYQTVIPNASAQNKESDTENITSETQTSDNTALTDEASDDTTSEDSATDSASEAYDLEEGNEVEDDLELTDNADASDTDPVITDNYYEDENIKISIETIREYDSNIYVADIQLSDAAYLQTALAKDMYGRNIKETTSEIAEEHNAILAINGDYYGFRDYGYVLRNGILYRDSAGDEDALVIDQSGDFLLLDQEESLSSLDLNSIWQILSFGPALIKDGEIVVDNNSEVGRAMTSNPRTAIGQISELHYIIIVSDGRTDESAGLSLKQLAEVFADRGCVTAYNLDGGGSSTMYFNGEIVNVPTDGRGIGEREVSDIVYIGY